MSIEIKNLYFKYDNLSPEILRDINLKIEKGEVVALMGASGSGKSTLIKIISSFLKPTSGTILVNNKPVRINQPFNAIGYVSQSSINTLFPWLTVENNIYYPSKLRKELNAERKKYCDELFKVLKIEHIRKSYPLKLSGGELKRLSLAVSLSYKPEIILLDEPFSGIDFNLAEELWDILYKDFKSRKPTVLFVTHSLDEATILADKVIFLNCSNSLIHPEKGISSYENSMTTPRHKLLKDPQVTKYKNYLLDKYNLALNE